MKRSTFVAMGLLTAALVAGAVGCGFGTGGGDGGKKLTLKAPADASLKPGETATINIEVTRTKFTDPVELKFTGLPEGVSIMEKETTIAKDVNSAKFTLQAAADTKAAGDHKVTVTATGGGLTQSATMSVSVQKKG